MTYKRYIVFGFNKYYPCGGFNDYLGDYDSVTEIDELIEKRAGGWDDKETWHFNGRESERFQIFDCQERVLIKGIEDRLGFL